MQVSAPACGQVLGSGPRLRLDRAELHAPPHL